MTNRLVLAKQLSSGASFDRGGYTHCRLRLRLVVPMILKVTVLPLTPPYLRWSALQLRSLMVALLKKFQRKNAHRSDLTYPTHI